MVEFKKVKSEEDTEQSSRQVAVLYIPPASKALAEEHLFDFICSLAQGRPRVQMPLVLEAATLRDVYADPHPELRQALGRCIDDSLMEISPDTSQWGGFDLSPEIFGVALAVHNALVPELVSEETAVDSMIGFTHALMDTLSPARNPHDILAGHALLRQVAESLPHLAPSRAKIMHRLIHLNPLTGICCLHRNTPPVLTPLAAETIPGWKRRVASPSPWKNSDDWLDALTPLMDNPSMAVFLRRRWLNFPQERSAFRNLGLLLEALRRRGNHREFLLEFYEAFDHANGLGINMRHWPVLKKIEDLFRTGGNSEEALEAAMRMNRWGHEFFFLFHPLTQIVRDEGGIPPEYNHLNPGWIPALRPLLDYVDDTPPQYFDMPDIAFESTWKGDRQEAASEESVQYRVVLHNDDVSTMEFVVEVLKGVFAKSSEEATEIMLSVHNKGTGICGIFPHDEAQEKVERVVSLAKERGFPLKCTMEDNSP